MDERDFWVALEFRICKEFASLQANHLRFLWCDGLIPDNYALDSNDPYIDGTAWMGGIGGHPPSYQEQWGFRLLLGRHFRSISEIPWHTLLPEEDVTGWLTFDLKNKTMVINPSRRMNEAIIVE
jgi:hypothetical protein